MNKKVLITFGIIILGLVSYIIAERVQTNNEKVKAPQQLQVTQKPINKIVNFSTFDVNKKYFNKVNGYVELILKLPRLDGNYDGIPEINKYFVNKEKFFYDELPLNDLKESNAKVEGAKDNWYRSADYNLEAELGNVISMSAYLNGGAGGVNWAGIEGDTFDLNTGKKLSLSDVFKVSKDEYLNFIYDFVSKKVMAEINRDKKSRSGYMFDDAYSDEGYKSIREFDPNDFYLSKDALVVFYQKYALAEGARGSLVFEIPYESISNMLAIDVKNALKPDTAVNNSKENSTQVKNTAEVQSRKQEFKDKLGKIQKDLDASEERKKSDEGTTVAMLDYANKEYTEWDKALNEIYNVLKQQLPPKDMKKLEIEELKWIKEKEARAESAGNEFKGGTLEPLARVSAAAQATKERSYELVDKYMK